MRIKLTRKSDGFEEYYGSERAFRKRCQEDDGEAAAYIQFGYVAEYPQNNGIDLVPKVLELYSARGAITALQNRVAQLEQIVQEAIGAREIIRVNNLIVRNHTTLGLTIEEVDPRSPP